MGLSEHAVKKMTVKQLHDELAKRDLDKKGAKAALQARLLKHLQSSASDTPVVPPPAKDDDTQTAAIAEVATISDSTANPPKAKQPNSSHDSADIASSNTVDTANTSTTPTVSSSSPDPSIEHAESKADSTAIDADKPLDGKRHLSPPLHSSPRAAKKPKLDATDSIPESKVSPTPTIRIDNFIRPFTLNAVKAFVQVDASFVDDGFWMDAIKTHCYVTYATTDAAIDARSRIYGTTWPELSGRQLTVDFSTDTAADIAAQQKAATTAAATPVPTASGRSNRREAADSSKAKDTTKVLTKPPVTADDLFCKTKAVPSLFYLPVSDDLVARRRANVERKKLGLIRPRPGRSSRRYRHRRRGGNRSSGGGGPLVQA
ncbi:hypothetical protein, variant 1 [Aphanomyces astaci]|uniref:SAP domain-containing protein n=1 Tax=Aphanomyces astaci TaxID=112090 RepID=W4G8W9_APHAT|nr:hypothetical protein, variant 1 [Aphanomyces astaci]ETV76132.1 hypothetical protein, variant 1 [Aphanomyces astaci]|eukprot:XP_009834258.1 hypothetical protein, variant 1 [Aphanomyces astaci]